MDRVWIKFLSLPLLAILVALASCTPTIQPFGDDTPLSLMTRITRQAQICWFANKNPIFADYKMAPELNSHAGKPRLLIVPQDNPGGLPKLVVQAENKSGQVSLSSFGPLLGTSHGPAINKNIEDWAVRGTKC